MNGVGVQDEGSGWSRKGRRLLVGQGATHQRGRDVGDLVAVDEPESVLGLHRDAVEEILFGDLEHVFHGAELGAARAQDRSTDRKGQVRDWATFLHGVPRFSAEGNLAIALLVGEGIVGPELRVQLRMFTAREITTATVTSEASDCTMNSDLAQAVNGMVSVGLNAVAFVNEV